MTSPKDRIRRQLVAARRNVTQAEHAAEANALAATVRELVNSGDTVCAYVPIGSEPGSLALLDTLLSNTRVLLPVARTGADGMPSPMSWGEYRPGELVTAPFGLREPGTATLPPDTIAQAGLVLVPALAVDRRGNRLGRGAGFYDRSLPLCRPRTRLIAVVRDDELVDELPADAHDVRMTGAVTPGRGSVTF